MGNPKKHVGTPRDRYYVNRMYQLLREKRMSIVKLSVRSGVPCSTIKNGLNASANPKIRTLEKICEGFGITIIEFYDTEEYRDIIKKERAERK